MTRDRLYNLLPAIYRIRDGAEGEPLRALLAVVEQELQILEGNVSDLYDDWFIETCAEWVVPYIGDLIDVRELYADRALTYGAQERRAYIANTLAYRRRKGTAPILEQLTRDVTGWRSRVVEFARLVNTTQHLDHLRPTSTTVNLRADNRLQQVGTPFETQAAYSVEVRPPSRGGRFNASNIGLYVWRLQSYPLERSTARLMAADPPNGSPQDSNRYYTFSPLGKDEPLFNQPQTETNIVNLAEEINLPVLLRRAPLANELTQRRQARSQGQEPADISYFDSDPVLQLFVNRQPRPVPPEEILIRSLDPWPDLAELQSLPEDTSVPLQTVAVDPELGRIAFLGQTSPQHLEVSYFYGFSDDVGGGSYGRADAPEVEPHLTDPDPTQIQISPLHWTVQQSRTADPNPLATTIQTWNQTVTAWEGFSRHTHIPLARLTIPAVHLAQIDRENVRQRFSPGIVGDGLSVLPGLCPTEVMVSAGIAVDVQGRSLRLRQFQSFDLQQVDLATLPDCTGILAIAYDPFASNAVKLAVMPETTLDGYPEGTFIPLARLRLNAQHQLIGSPDPQVRLPLQAGIVQGLEVQTRPGTLETFVTAGTGVDAQGRVVVLSQNHAVEVRPYQGQVRSLVLGIPNRFGSSWQIDLLPPSDLETLTYPVLHLANLEIPSVQISQLDLEVRSPDWAIQGLEVSPSGAQISIAPGSIRPAQTTSQAASAPTPQKPLLQLARSQRLDLSPYAGRTLILLMAIARHPGLPLDFAEPPQGRGWRNLGIVPEQPLGASDGLILIGDNQTYVGDLAIVLPPQQRLVIVAANGYRPHIQGAITIEGTAIAAETDRRQGELRLDGMLIEGLVRVASGNLGQLAIQHCTLMPDLGGLCVEAETSEPPRDSNGSDLTLAAFLVYCLNQIWMLIQQELGLRRSSPPLTMAEVMRRIVQRITMLLAELSQKLQACFGMNSWNGEETTPTPTRQENSRLELSLYRTITGAIALPDTVPHLSLEDCIVDPSASAEAPDTSEAAIAAPGTVAEILTTTVFGRTQVRQLEASNSLFTEKVTVLRHQEGCLRFCYVPEGSQTPRRYQCQPDRAFRDALDQIPQPVSSLFLDPASSSPLLLVGTSGDGVFRLGGEQVQGWLDINADLPTRHITALLAYRRPSADSDPSPEPNTLLVGTLSGQIFQAIPEQIPGTGEDEPDEPSVNWQIPDWSPLPFTATNAAIAALQYIESSNPAIAPSLWAATAGGGIWQAESTGRNWSAINTGLTNLNVTTLLWDKAQQQLWAGTWGDGVFVLRYSKNEEGKETEESKETEEGEAIAYWAPQNTGLGDRRITALVQDSQGQIWASTQGGGLFSREERGWIPANDGLTSLDITALVAFQTSSTVSSNNNTVTGRYTYFIQRGLQPDQMLTVGGQSHEIESIQSETELTLKTAFDPPLVEASFSTDEVLIAGTADGKLFRSLNRGGNWHPLALDLKGIDITTLAVGSLTAGVPVTLVAGTAAGELLRSDDGGQQWLSVLAGRPDLAQKLQIIHRIQPNFTSTRYGDPGYAQLRKNGAIAIRTGAEDGSELGVFNRLKQPQREANLRASLDEYLRFGLSADIFYVT